MSHYAGRAVRQVWSVAGRLFTTSSALLIISLSPAPLEAQSLPPDWTATNIGSPASPGRATYSGSTFTIEGGGTTVFGTSDQFFYVHRRLTGDATIVARVTAVENTDPWAKAGVMIRESLASSSRHAFLMVTPAKGIVFQRRATTGGTTTAGSSGASGTAPVWLRLVRRGSTFTASRSTNGTSWATMGSTTVSMGSTVYVGMAVSAYDAIRLATATFTGVSVSTPTGLPAGWSGTDVGNPAVDGNVAYSGGAFSLYGGGADIWGTSDQFGFVYRQVSGDVDVTARVASLSGPDEWSKAGVMVRTSLAANSAHASLFLSRSKGVAFQRRPSTGALSLHTSGGDEGAPVWVRLERRGTAVTAFTSADGASWRMIGSQTLTLGTTFYVGLAVTAHDTTTGATGVFSGVSVAAPGSGTSPLTPPTVSLTAPASGATFAAGVNVTISASASDADDGVAQVEFYANGTRLGTDVTSPYAFTWPSIPAGSYTLTAVARDTRGAEATSAPRGITVTSSGGGNTPPTVSLSAPASGAIYAAGASVVIAASAGDSDGSVARVDFYAGSTLIGSDTTSPYGVTWTNVPAGSYSLTALARDNDGASTRSAARSILVTALTIPNRAVFSPSPDHATVTYRLDVFTAGANPSTAAPIGTQQLGRPSVVNGECTADIGSLITGLPGGSYFATVVAVSSSGTSLRATSATFAR